MAKKKLNMGGIEANFSNETQNARYTKQIESKDTIVKASFELPERKLNELKAFLNLEEDKENRSLKAFFNDRIDEYLSKRKKELLS